MTRTAAANGPATAPAVEERQAEAGLLDQVVMATQAARQYSLEEVRYMAQAAAKSRMFGMEESQAFVLMELCEAEGLHPIQALRRYDIIDGKPAMKAAAMQAEFQRRGGRITWIERTAEACEAEFVHPVLQPKPLNIRTTLKDLKDRGIAIAKDGGLKRNYQQNPRPMLHARVISEGVRAIDPGIVVGLYTPEEVSDFDEPPSPRPFPADAPASRVEPKPIAVEAAAAEPAPQPQPSEVKLWIQQRVDDANNDWAMTCARVKRDYKPLCTLWQVVNALVTKWLEDSLIAPEQVQNDSGKRSNSKMGAVLKQMWADDRDETRDDIDMYLRSKIEEAAREAGINLDSEPSGDAV